MLLNSKQFSILSKAHQLGISTQVNIAGRTIVYEPGLASSGMTLFSENGFVLGREAFGSNMEAGKTVLHELYRLTTSGISSGDTGVAVSAETNAAFNFAEKTFELLKYYV